MMKRKVLEKFMTHVSAIVACMVAFVLSVLRVGWRDRRVKPINRLYLYGGRRLAPR